MKDPAENDFFEAWLGSVKDVLDLLPVGILIVAADATVLYVNQFALGILGYDNEHDLVGKTCSTKLCPDKMGGCPVLRGLKTRHSGEKEITGHEGKKTYVLKNVFRTEVFGRQVQIEVFQDITERKQAEEVLKQKEELLDAIASSTLDALIVMDARGEIALWNQAAEAMFGYRRTEVEGKDLHDLVAPADYRDLIDAGMKEFRLTGTGPAVGKVVELVATKSDGSRFPVEISLASYKKGDEYWAIATVRDITERKRYETELEKRKSELEEINRRLVENHEELVQAKKLASLGKLAAGIAHEINNPIGYVKSNLVTLGDYMEKVDGFLKDYREFSSAVADYLADDHKARLDEIRKSEELADLDFILEDSQSLVAESLEGSNRVQNIVKDLKTFARLDESEVQEASIGTCLESALEMVKPLLPKDCKFDLILEDTPVIRCHPSLLNQAFYNILINSVEALGKDGEIKLHCRVENEVAVIEISDNGAGIREEHLPDIFDPFFTTKEVGTGMGLGLSTAYRIIKKHGGEISVTSVFGKGTTVRVTLPVNKHGKEERDDTDRC